MMGMLPHWAPLPAQLLPAQKRGVLECTTAPGTTLAAAALLSWC